MHLPDDHASVGARALGASAVLRNELGLLLAMAVAAIPECIGVALVIRGPTAATTVSAFLHGRDRAPVRASLAVDLPRPSPSTRPTATLILFAEEPGAFSPVAPQVLALLDMSARHVTVDGHLTTPDLDRERRVASQLMRERRDVNRALGLLLGRGMLLDAGLVELRRLGAASGKGIVAAARALLAGHPPI